MAGALVVFIAVYGLLMTVYVVFGLAYLIFGMDTPKPKPIERKVSVPTPTQTKPVIKPRKTIT